MKTEFLVRKLVAGVIITNPQNPTLEDSIVILRALKARRETSRIREHRMAYNSAIRHFEKIAANKTRNYMPCADTFDRMMAKIKLL